MHVFVSGDHDTGANVAHYTRHQYGSVQHRDRYDDVQRVPSRHRADVRRVPLRRPVRVQVQCLELIQVSLVFEHRTRTVLAQPLRTRTT